MVRLAEDEVFMGIMNPGRGGKARLEVLTQRGEVWIYESNADYGPIRVLDPDLVLMRLKD